MSPTGMPMGKALQVFKAAAIALIFSTLGLLNAFAEEGKIYRAVSPNQGTIPLNYKAFEFNKTLSTFKTIDELVAENAKAKCVLLFVTNDNMPKEDDTSELKEFTEFKTKFNNKPEGHVDVDKDGEAEEKAKQLATALRDRFKTDGSFKETYIFGTNNTVGTILYDDTECRKNNIAWQR